MKIKTNIYQNIASFLDLFSGDLGYLFRYRFYKMAGVKLGKGVKIFRNVKINQPYNLEIGSFSEIGVGGVISGMKKIKIGENTLISPYCCLYDHNHKGTSKFEYNSSPIEIGNNCWIGAHCIILMGVKIGNNVIIGAGSVVNKSVPDNCVAVGVPAKVIKKIK